MEELPCKSTFDLYQQLVHAVATDADVNVKPGGLLSTGEGERTSVSKHALCVVCGLYAKMSTVATLLVYVQTSHLGKVPQVCHEHMLRADVRSAFSLLACSVDEACAAVKSIAQGLQGEELRGSWVVTLDCAEAWIMAASEVTR